MFTVSSQDLQKQVGDVQHRAAREPVLITAHGKPRCVLLSVEEFSRLKLAAGEAVAPVLRRTGGVYSQDVDPLGYDLIVMDKAMLSMADDAISGRTTEAVDTELAGVRRRLGKPK